MKIQSVVELLHFDDELRAMSPEDFVEHVLVEREHAHAVVVGENFRFGSGRSGDTTALRLCLERIAPPRKGRPVVLDLPLAPLCSEDCLGLCPDCEAAG